MVEHRVREGWRSRACAAGMSVGTQVFLFGTGAAMPIALNSAWIAALAVLPVSAVVTAVCCKMSSKKRAFSRSGCILLALTLLANAVFAISALVGFAEQTLLEQTPLLWSTVVTVIAVFLCALSGGDGVSRLSFALRFALPALIAVLIGASVPMKVPIGLFPVLGQGASALCMAALCMLGAASPALMLLLPPPDIDRAGEMAQTCPMPEAGFFVRRVLVGAGVGVLILLAACVCTTYESIAGSAVWGARLRIVASDQPHEGIPQTLLVVLQMTAITLLAVHMLSSAAQALSCVLRWAGKMHAGLAALSVLLLVMLALLTAWGFELALLTAPLLIVPTLTLPLICRRREDDPR